MIDLEILKQHGLTENNLRTWMAVDPLAPSDGTENGRKRDLLRKRIRSRIMEGQGRNYANYRTYYALDLAWDTPFRQISPTLLQQFLDQDPSDEEVYKKMKDWGLTTWITEEKDPKTGKPTGKKVANLPMFFNVIVPLVRAYVTIRWAKIMNDRRLTPFFKYEPLKQTTPMRAKCEALTDRIQVMSNQYGYFDVMKQSVLQMLHYGFCLQFPKTEWDYEEHWKTADAMDVAAGAKKYGTEEPANVGDTIKVTTREGIAYHHPHPTRSFWDIAHGPYTFNYDYGCQYGGYWQIVRYRDLLATKFWNKDKITFGTADFMSGNHLFFTSVYSACTLTIPSLDGQTPPKTDGGAIPAATGTGTTPLDRERNLANQYYGTDFLDRGVLVTEYFERLIPSENGLGDYDCPVWFRFVVAGDSATILYAAPLPYSPIIYYGYDADQNRGLNNASLSLEILPWQDQFSNVLSQILLTAKQNLTNLTFVDEDAFASGSEKEASSTMQKIRNIGQSLFSAVNIFAYSSKALNKMKAGDRTVPNVVQSWNFPKGNTAELINVLKTILDVLERVLVMSSHEVAQAASHEQTREEVRNIAQSTSSRLQFTATPVDLARDAWKRQLYAGLMAYGDDAMFIHIPSDIPLDKKGLEALGFTFLEKDAQFPPNGNEHYVRVMAKKKHLTAMPLWEFSSTRDGEDRGNDAAMGQVMATLMKDLLANPLTAPAIGAQQAIDIANQIAQLAGLPRDFKLRVMSDGQPDQAAAQQQLQQIIQAVLPEVHQSMQTELQPLLEATKKNSQAIEIMKQQAADKAKETISLNYKDVPNDIKRQMEARAGFDPSREHIGINTNAEPPTRAEPPQIIPPVAPNGAPNPRVPDTMPAMAGPS